MERIFGSRKQSSFSSKSRTSERGEHRHENDGRQDRTGDKTVEAKGFRELT